VEVNKYISQLLYNHDCVILPDFGGFVANYKPASIDYVHNTFYPPRKELLFNRSLSQNDGLLINHMSQIEGIEYIESKNIIVGFVKETITKLRNGEKVVFDGIGTFYYDIQKNIQFEPDTTQNYLLESYGLTSFHSPAVKRVQDTDRRIIVPAKQEEKLSVRRKNIRRMVAAAALILALSIVNTDSYNTDNTSTLNPFSGVTKVENVVIPKIDSKELKKEIVIAVADDKPKEVISTTKFESGETTIPKEIKTAQKKYYLIAGSFTDEVRAKIFNNKLKKSGYSPVVLEPSKGRHRVAFSVFYNKKEALSELKRIRKTKDSSAWLFIKK